MSWKRLIDVSNDDIMRGSLLKFNSDYPFEQEVVMMFCEVPSGLGKFGLITITGNRRALTLILSFQMILLMKIKSKIGLLIIGMIFHLITM